ncbi:hypothetical protein THO17_28750 [Marinomonas sp. THO17]
MKPKEYPCIALMMNQGSTQETLPVIVYLTKNKATPFNKRKQPLFSKPLFTGNDICFTRFMWYKTRMEMDISIQLFQRKNKYNKVLSIEVFEFK